MSTYRFRAWLTLADDAHPRPYSSRHSEDEAPSNVERLLVHAWLPGEPMTQKFFPSVISSDDGQPLTAGRRTLVTLALTDEAAPAYLAAGRPFTVTGHHNGRGIVSRRVFTDFGPS